MIVVRPATEADVLAMSAALTASITQLCSLDHRDDPAAIAAWTANKTPAGVTAMLHAEGNRMFVAERGGEIAAVGCIIGPDQIGLNYVHPAHRFQGVSRALLAAMEDVMRNSGTIEGRLASTTTAHAFYRANGWVDATPPSTDRPISGWPMRKIL